MSKSVTLFEDAKRVYEAWLSQQGYSHRQGQIEMIRSISDALTRGRDRISVVEAGTGTGKTASYCIPAALEARRLGKKLVIVTSTVLLQQQLINGELKQLADLFSPGLTYGIIKGRRRYACISLLNKHAHDATESDTDLFGNKNPSARDRRVAMQLFDHFQDRSWRGDLDVSPVSLSSRQTQTFSTDAFGCHQRTCEFASPCPYFKARNQTVALDVVVTNYSLLLLSLRDDIDLLPAPEDCIYVFDEVHRLADIVMESGRMCSNTDDVIKCVNQIETFINRLVNIATKDHPLYEIQQDLLNTIPTIREQMDDLLVHFEQLGSSKLIEKAQTQNGAVFRFITGKIDPTTTQRTQVIAVPLGVVRETLERLHSKLSNDLAERKTWIEPDQLGAAIRLLAEMLSQFKEHVASFDDWGKASSHDAARWLNKDGTKWELNTVPVAAAVSEFLDQLIWSQAHSVICTSATIYSSDGFGQFRQEAGLNLPDAHFSRIASPFNFRDNVKFQIADVPFNQPGSQSFNAVAAKRLPGLLQEDISGLILFTSRHDMKEVYGMLIDRFKHQCLMQGMYSLAETIKRHQENIDAGKKSYIFGLVSYREGVDLPGDYCQHVVIMRIPFNVPNDPVIKTQKELLQLKNPFMQYDVPQASLRLFQACGRLLRSEQDKGTITVFDRRLVENQNYRDELMRPLPNFKVIDLGRPRK